MNARWIKTSALVLSLAVVSIVLFQNCGESSKNRTAASEDSTFNGVGKAAQTSKTANHEGVKLKFLICDVKRSISQREGRINSTNYKLYIDAFKNKIGCNGIRFHVDSKTETSKISKTADDRYPESYTKLYRDAFAYARSKGLLIYSNLLPELDGVLEYGFQTNKWAENMAAYANHFCPDFLGVMNENQAYDHPTLLTMRVRENLKQSCVDPSGKKIAKIRFTGTDAGEVSGALGTIKNHQNYLDTVDIVSAHNNNGGMNFEGGGAQSKDRSATASDWGALFAKADGRPVWASEASNLWNARPFRGDNKDRQVGIKAIMESKVVSGLVLYMAEKRLDPTTFELTDDGKDIVNGLRSSGWNYPN